MSGRWVRRGLLYSPDRGVPWACSAVMTPTPILLGDVIRIFAGFCDKAGVSRIGFIDVVADNPAKIIRVCQQPVLDLGAAGAFDDNGIILGDLISLEASKRHWRLYYVGFQKVEKAKFLAFTGVAESADGTQTFTRISQSPILDRADESIHIRAAHCVLREDSGFRIWYSVGDGWENINNQPYPRYRVKTQFSKDGLSFSDNGEECIFPQGDEYRLGRFRVQRKASCRDDALFTAGTVSGSYLAFHATLDDSKRWQRQGIWLSPSGLADDWDSHSVCYPAVIEVSQRQFAFYNGNGMGKTGFGWAEWEGVSNNFF